MSDVDMKAELERLRRENQELKESRKKGRALNLKVSQKGAVSLYGMGRFPGHPLQRAVASRDRVRRRDQKSSSKKTKVP